MTQLEAGYCFFFICQLWSYCIVKLRMCLVFHDFLYNLVKYTHAHTCMYAHAHTTEHIQCTQCKDASTWLPSVIAPHPQFHHCALTNVPAPFSNSCLNSHPHLPWGKNLDTFNVCRNPPFPPTACGRDFFCFLLEFCQILHHSVELYWRQTGDLV